MNGRMLLSWITILLAALVFSGASLTQKHNHNHQRLQDVKRAQVQITADIVGAPIYEYIVNGKMVALNEVCKGIEAGSLVWQNPNDASRCLASGTEASGTTTATSIEVSGSTIATFFVTELPASQAFVVNQTQDVNTTPVPSVPSVAVEHKQDVKATPAPSLASVTVQQKQDSSTYPVQSTQAPDFSAESLSSTPAHSTTTRPKGSAESVSSTAAQSTTSVPEHSAKPVPSTPTQSPTTAPKVSAESVSSTPAQSMATAPEPSAKPFPSSPAKSPATTLSDPAPVSTSSAAEPSSVEASSSQSGNIYEGQGLDMEFPDGMIDCTTFPSQYGPIDVEWLQHGGWTGIQSEIIVEGKFVTHIKTEKPGDSDYKGCSPGTMCSYACPPGYQKSQWPSTQGKPGTTVGGLRCNEAGKLTLTNPDLSKTLCMEGTGTVDVQNKLSSNVAICRTDYPGTESETIPMDTQPDSINPLTCPDSNEYFHWHETMATSAQYYINDQGVPVEKACVWGEDGSNRGNWAPTTLGVHRDPYGRTWLSIGSTTQNNPINSSSLDYTITIEGDLGFKCRYSDGKYCGGNNYEDCSKSWCESELLSGQGTYVLSD